MSWQQLREKFGAEIVDAVRARLLSGAAPQVDKAPFVAAGHAAETVAALFDALVADGQLERREMRLCPDCGLELGIEIADDGVCPHCEFDMGEQGKPPIPKTVFLSPGLPSREIPWLVALHGFNTTGDWQEDFGWLLATRFRHRAPALMHKFLFLSFGVLLRKRHDTLVAELDRKLRAAMERARASGIEEPPDIIAHSFGSLLLVKLLDRPDSADLKFGRIVVAGSIVRPDYQWTRHIRSGRVEAVLNHCSRKDGVVDYAQWTIPDSGPSGRVGFDEERVINHMEADFDHGTHFDPTTMIESLRAGGTWDRFLRLPVPSLEDAFASIRPASPWRPAPKAATAIAHVALIVLAIVVSPLVVIKSGAEALWKGTI